MRPLRTAVLIVGLFQPLVIHAQPFGTTDVTAYDTDFLEAPAGPAPEAAPEPPMPEWVALVPDEEPPPQGMPPILPTEIPS